MLFEVRKRQGKIFDIMLQSKILPSYQHPILPTADVIFAVDAGGQTGNGNFGTFSKDTVDPGIDLPFTLATCPIDNVDTNKICRINEPLDSSSSTYSAGSKGRCCDMCVSFLAQGLGCLSDNDPSTSNLGISLAKYSSKVSNSKAPPFPTTNTNFEMGNKVVIFGCKDVATSTPIVNIPNRVIKSGHSGHYTLKGAFNLQYSPDNVRNPEQQFTTEAVEAFWENAKASLPSKSGLPDFDTCIACLYYAKAMGNNDYMQNNDGSGACKGCYSNYCYEGLL